MNYKVFYARQPTFGFRDVADVDGPSHTFLLQIEASSLDDVFYCMQGEIWSPNGEARTLLQALGLHHTSMSVGDIAQDEDGVYWLCCMYGWKPLHRGLVLDEQAGDLWLANYDRPQLPEHIPLRQ